MLNLNICSGCNESCSCGGYYLPWDPITEECSSTCEDGLIVLEEDCDDNNNISGDGCSAQCTVEPFYECVGEPSNCSLLGNLVFDRIERKGCNSFSLILKMTPLIPEREISKIIDLISIPHPNITQTRK